MPKKTIQLPGLTGTETALYELLLRLGEVPASQLILEAKIKRATVYSILYVLEKKGLVFKREIGKKLYFKPESPSKLLAIADAQISLAERSKETLGAIMPGLSSLYIFSTEKPVVRVYEGVEGLKQIYIDTLQTNQPIYAALETATVDDTLFKWLTDEYSKKRAKLKIHAKVIISTGSWATEYKKRDVEEFRTSVLVPRETFPFQHELDIYGNKVAFIHYKKDEPLIGIVITHPNIAKSMKALFDLAWTGAEALHSNGK